MTGAEIVFIVQGIIALAASVVELLQANSPEERDAILVSMRAKRAQISAELDTMADAAEARIAARSGTTQ